MTQILCGFKGAGKTHFGKLLSDYKNLPFFDTDALLEKEHHKTVRALYQDVGEEMFRMYESKIIQTLPKIPSVIAIGGGSLIQENNAKHLKTLGTLIYLKADFATLVGRMREIPPFINYATYVQRIPLYETYADITIDLEKTASVLEVLYGL